MLLEAVFGTPVVRLDRVDVDVEYKLDGGTLKTVTHRNVASLAALQTEVTGELVRLRQDSKILSTFREIDQFVKESGVLQLDDTPAAKE